MSRRVWSHRPIERAVAAKLGKHTGADAARLLKARAYQLDHAADLIAKADAKRRRKAAARTKAGGR